MARRKLAQRQVTSIAMPQSSDAEALSTFSDTAHGFIELEKKKDQANMMDFMANAKVQMLDATNNWRTQNEADPANREALGNLNSSYNEILGQYTDKVGMLSRGDWAKAVNRIKSQYQMDNLQWAQKQSVVNMEKRVNDSMQKSLTMFSDLGSKGDLDNFFKEYEGNKADIENFSANIIGDATRQKLMEDYESDAMFSYLAGMAKTNPEQALLYIDDDKVKESINDPKKVDSAKNMIKSLKSQRDYFEKENLIQTRINTTMDILAGDYDITDTIKISNEIGAKDPKFAEAIIKSLENNAVETDDEAFAEVTKNIFASNDKNKISEFVVSALKDGRIRRDRMSIIAGMANSRYNEINGKTKYGELSAKNIFDSFKDVEDRAVVTERVFKRFNGEKPEGEEILKITNEEIRKQKRVTNKNGSKYSIDDIVPIGGYTYKVTGFDDSGSPILEEL